MTTDDDAVPMRRWPDGDLYPARMDEPGTPPHLCRRGWLAPAPDGTPVPCLVCKPHLIRRRLRDRRDPAATARGRALARRVLVDAGVR